MVNIKASTPQLCRGEGKSIRWVEGGTRLPRKAQKDPAEWLIYRPIIQRVWDNFDPASQNGRRKAYVRQYMIDNYDFHAEEHDYKNKIDKWRKEGTGKLEVPPTTIPHIARRQSSSSARAKNCQEQLRRPVLLQSGEPSKTSTSNDSSASAIVSAARSKRPAALISIADSFSREQMHVDEPEQQWHREPELQPKILMQDRSAEMQDLEEPRFSPTKYSAWMESRSAEVQLVCKLEGDLRGLDWCNEAEMMSLTWDHLSCLRQAAGAYLACGLSRMAFLFNHLVWRRLWLSNSCDWGDLPHARCRQLIYCIRSAKDPEERAVARYLTDSYLACSPGHITSKQDGLLRAFLRQSGHTSASCSPRKDENHLDNSEDPMLLDVVLFAFYEWCIQKMMRTTLSSWSNFGPDTWRTNKLGATTVRYLNTLHLFSFFWSDKRLIGFSKLIDKPNATNPDVMMLEWACYLRDQLNVSLADIIWTVASTLIHLSQAARCEVMSFQLFGEVLQSARLLSSMSRSRICMLLRENSLRGEAEYEDVVYDDVAQLVSDLIWGTSPLPKVPNPYDRMEVYASPWTAIGKDSSSMAFAPSCASSSLCSMRKVAQRAKGNVPWDTDSEENMEQPLCGGGNQILR